VVYALYHPQHQSKQWTIKREPFNKFAGTQQSFAGMGAGAFLPKNAAFVCMCIS